MDEYQNICSVLVQLARLVVGGKEVDAIRYLQRVVFENRNSDALVWIELKNLTDMLSPQGENRSWKNISRVSEPPYSPRDVDTQFELLTKETPPIVLDVIPVFSQDIQNALDMVVKERKLEKGIRQAGLTISNKLIFSGPPGVGKTLAARWLSNKLKLPLYTLNLAAVMSSFLGKTGNNLQRVFQFVSQHPCILLLDEFDAIAKRREDNTDVGELKRLVTVLLQEFDKFSNSSVLIAATNHQALLDSAVWRRFDVSIVFPLPNQLYAKTAIKSFFGQDVTKANKFLDVLATLMSGLSFSEIKRDISHIRKQSMINNSAIETCIIDWIAEHCAALKASVRKQLALSLTEQGYSQRDISKWTGVSRDTIRNAQREANHA